MTRFASRMIPLVAVFMVLALAGSALAADKANGKIKTVTADKKEFVLTDKDGKDWNFKMAETGKIKLNDKDSQLDDLKVGDQVEVSYDKLGELFIAAEVRCKRE